MQAVIIREKFDPREHYDELLSELASNAITAHTINSIAELPNLLPNLVQDQPFLFYRNVSMRIEYPAEVLRWHSQNLNFHNIQIDRELVTFIPERTTVFRDNIINKCLLEAIESHFFKISNFKVWFKKHDTKCPHIFMYTHNRAKYFQLALDSLWYSLNDDTSVPVTLFLNQPTPQVREIALEFWKQHTHINVVEIQNNSYFSAINLAVQWAKPESFIVCEDDFIMPATARELFPNWPYTFQRRLNHFDLVGWGPTVDNAPLSDRFARFTDKIPHHEWVYAGKGYNYFPTMLGHALAMKTEYWKSCMQGGPWYLPLDSHLIHKANAYCLPGLHGYHIGWNQNMDGYGSLENRTRPAPPIENVLRSLVNEDRVEKFRLDAISAEPQP